MDVKELIRIMGAVEPLKYNTRHSWSSAGRQESVAEHSWGLCMLALLVRDEYPELDMDKVLRMCVLHDVGEAFTGDIPAFYKTEQHEAAETDALQAWVNTLPQPYRAEFSALYAEMDALQTGEAKLYKALDKMETLIQHNLADLSTWLPLEHTANLTYGEKETAFSPWTAALKAQIKADSIAKMQAQPAPDPAAAQPHNLP